MPRPKLAKSVSEERKAIKGGKNTGPMTLPRLVRKEARVYLIGESPLITHAWSLKARLLMLAASMGQKLPKYPKSPVQDFLDSMYRTEDGGYGFPSVGLKKALASACVSMNKEISRTQVQQAFFVPGEPGHSKAAMGTFDTPMQLVRIYTPNPPAMREDPVKVGGYSTKTADLHYRAQFEPWAMQVDIAYNGNMVTDATVMALLETAGFAVGLGEWRNEKSGTYGQFRLASPSEIKTIQKWMKMPPKEPALPDEQKFLEMLAEAVRRFGAEQATGEEVSAGLEAVRGVMQ